MTDVDANDVRTKNVRRDDVVSTRARAQIISASPHVDGVVIGVVVALLAVCLVVGALLFVFRQRVRAALRAKFGRHNSAEPKFALFCSWR